MYPDASDPAGHIAGFLEIGIVLDDDGVFQKDGRVRLSANIQGSLERVGAQFRSAGLAYGAAGSLRHVETIGNVNRKLLTKASYFPKKKNHCRV